MGIPTSNTGSGFDAPSKMGRQNRSQGVSPEPLAITPPTMAHRLPAGTATGSYHQRASHLATERSPRASPRLGAAHPAAADVHHGAADPVAAPARQVQAGVGDGLGAAEPQRELLGVGHTLPLRHGLPGPCGSG